MTGKIRYSEQIHPVYLKRTDERTAMRAARVLFRYNSSDEGHLDGIQNALRYILYTHGNDSKKVNSTLGDLEALSLDDSDHVLEAISSVAENWNSFGHCSRLFSKK